jgi:signal transduction histidine kinase
VSKDGASPPERVQASTRKGYGVAAHDESASAAEPCLVLGEVARLLTGGGAPDPALAALQSGFHLSAVALRDASGAVVAGTTSSSGPTHELPVHGRSGSPVGTLVVSGAVPAQLPALRTAAAVLGLALAPAAVEDLEADREALADALHDGPVQSLVVARYAADAAARGGDAGLARDALQSALVELRRFLWHVRPRGSAGFVEALDQLSAQLTEAGSPALGLVGDVEAAAALRGAAGVTAYRLVQAVARPGAPAVRVALRRESGRLVLDVEGGAALSNPEAWARRAQALGGELQTSTGRTRLVLPPPDVRTSS